MSEITTDFITATKRILAKVGTILTHVEVIEGDVKLIREQVVANANKPRTEPQAHNSKNENPNSVLPSNSSETERQENKSGKETKNSFERFLERWWDELHKPKFQVAVLTLAGLIAYTCETSRTNDLTQKSLDLTRESIAAHVTIDDWGFIAPVVAGKQIAIEANMKNVGHVPALYGIEAISFRGTNIPDSIPIEAPQPTSFIEPDKPGLQGIYDTQVATEQFIYDIPHLRELTTNPATRNFEPPLPRPTVFFMGRLVYDSLGIRTEQQFCFFIVYADGYGPSKKPANDDRFVFVTCPKWNKTIVTAIP